MPTVAPAAPSSRMMSLALTAVIALGALLPTGAWAQLTIRITQGIECDFVVANDLAEQRAQEDTHPWIFRLIAALGHGEVPVTIRAYMIFDRRVARERLLGFRIE